MLFTSFSCGVSRWYIPDSHASWHTRAPRLRAWSAEWGWVRGMQNGTFDLPPWVSMDREPLSPQGKFMPSSWLACLEEKGVCSADEAACLFCHTWLESNAWEFQSDRCTYLFHIVSRKGSAHQPLQALCKARGLRCARFVWQYWCKNV